MPKADCKGGCGKQTEVRTRSTGYCRQCANRRINSNPDKLRRMSETMKKHFDDPEFREQHRIRTKLGAQRRSPETKRQHAERLREVRHLGEQARRERYSGDAWRKQVAQKIRASRLAWLHPALRDEWLRRSRRTVGEGRQRLRREFEDRNAMLNGKVDDAAHWLRRIAPVSRQPCGSYRFGSALLSPSEVVKSAQLRGWKP